LDYKFHLSSIPAVRLRSDPNSKKSLPPQKHQAFTVSDIIKRIKELSQLGFTHAIFNMPDVYKMSSLETFSKEIIPEVAEL